MRFPPHDEMDARVCVFACVAVLRGGFAIIVAR